MTREQIKVLRNAYMNNKTRNSSEIIKLCNWALEIMDRLEKQGVKGD